VTPQVVRADFDPGPIAGLLDDQPGGRISDREDPFLGLQGLFPHVFAQPLRHLVRDEDDLLLPTTFR